MRDLRGWLWAFLALTLCLAGASLAGAPATGAEGEVVHMPIVHGRPGPTLTPTPWPTLHAFVSHIVDGDTIDVRYHDVTLRVRYIGVDTPERGDPTRGAAYCYGYPAATRNAELVMDRWVDLERDIDERGPWNRYLYYVYVDGNMVNEQLIDEGFALCYTVPDNVKYAPRLMQAEEAARVKGRGLWGDCVAAKPTPAFDVPDDPAYGVRITYMHYINDEEPEYVRLGNSVEEAVQLAGWTLVSEPETQRFEFPEMLLGPGEIVYVCSGLGARERTGPPRHLLWGEGYRWNDQGDRARLYAPDGTLVDAWPYGDWQP